jgi:hypothetical protein
MPQGWTFDLFAGEAALAELIQNLLLFLPLGACLVLAGVRPFTAIIIGFALSGSVEFLQQWIPGRDPSVGDIICNTVSTALGAAVAVRARAWLFPPPQRSAWLALGIAGAALLAWLGTGLVLQPVIPPSPYYDAWTPDYQFWGHYRGTVLAARLDGVTLAQSAFDGQALLEHGAPLHVTVVASNHWPDRPSPLVALLDNPGHKVLVLAVHGRSLAARYYTKAEALTLEPPDLRWRKALAGIAPQDTFVAQMWRGADGVCLAVNSGRRCGFGYTIGDGWKLIYFPQGFPAWMYAVLNVMWVGGWVLGVGWWGTTAGEGGRGRATAATAIVLLGLIVVPVITGLKATPIQEWIGALGGLGPARYGVAWYPGLITAAGPPASKHRGHPSRLTKQLICEPGEILEVMSR